MIIRKHNHLGIRILRFIVLMFVLISFSFLSTHHIEMRFVTKGSSDMVMEYKYKSFVKHRQSLSTQRMSLSLELFSVVIFAVQIVAFPFLTTPIFRRLRSISILKKRLFLMPIQLTSTAI
jgi:hypothetical protein